MIADLHAHSRISDGSLGIDEMVFFAKRAGLSFLALTDHDTMAGVVRAQVLGKRYGIEVVPGVEISCIDEESAKPIHVLCYLPQKPDRLEGFLKTTLDRRTAAGKKMIENVMRYYPLTPEHVARYYSNSQSIYRVHIMHALCDLGYDNRIYGTVYKQIFGPQGSCRVLFEYPTLEAALAIVRDAQGLAVIAHPGAGEIEDVCERLAHRGAIQGIEVHHPRNSPGTTARLMEVCQRFDLIPTGGTDFHGLYMQQPYPLGSFIAPADTLERLYALRKKRP